MDQSKRSKLRHSVMEYNYSHRFKEEGILNPLTARYSENDHYNPIEIDKMMDLFGPPAALCDYFSDILEFIDKTLGDRKKLYDKFFEILLKFDLTNEACSDLLISINSKCWDLKKQGIIDKECLRQIHKKIFEKKYLGYSELSILLEFVYLSHWKDNASDYSLDIDTFDRIDPECFRDMAVSQLKMLKSRIAKGKFTNLEEYLNWKFSNLDIYQADLFRIWELEKSIKQDIGRLKKGGYNAPNHADIIDKWLKGLLFQAICRRDINDYILQQECEKIKTTNILIFRVRHEMAMNKGENPPPGSDVNFGNRMCCSKAMDDRDDVSCLSATINAITLGW